MIRYLRSAKWSTRLYGIIYGRVLHWLPPPRDSETQQVMWDANQVADGIYLGSIKAAYQQERMREEGITHVVTVIIGVSAAFPRVFDYHLVDVRDVPEESIVDKLNGAVDYIHHAIKNNGKVLVHCMKGRSRSSTVVAAYLIKYNDMEVDEALRFIKRNRSIAQPNEGFYEQLHHFYRCVNSNKENEDIKEYSQDENNIINTNT